MTPMRHQCFAGRSGGTAILRGNSDGSRAFGHKLTLGCRDGLRGTCPLFRSRCAASRIERHSPPGLVTPFPQLGTQLYYHKRSRYTGRRRSSDSLRLIATCYSLCKSTIIRKPHRQQIKEAPWTTSPFSKIGLLFAACSDIARSTASLRRRVGIDCMKSSKLRSGKA